MLVTKINNGLCPVRLYKSSYNNPNCINYAASNLTPPMNNLSAAYFIPFGISHKTDFKETINYADSSQKELELVRDKKSGRIIDAKVFRYNGTLDKHFKYDRATGNKIFYAKYFNDIFMVTNAQTSILTRVNDFVGEKNKLISYEYIPITGKDKGKVTSKLVWNETLVVWLRDSAILQNGLVYKKKKIGGYYAF